MITPTRRSVLGGGAVLLSSLAGCSSSSDEQGTETGASGTVTRDLDLREANVTEVAMEDQGDGEYRFDVTLYHDVHKSEALVQPIRNLRFLRTMTAKTATRTGGRSRHLTASSWGGATSCTLTAPSRSPALRRYRSPAASRVWWFGATTRPTATAGG